MLGINLIVQVNQRTGNLLTGKQQLTTKILNSTLHLFRRGAGRYRNVDRIALVRNTKLRARGLTRTIKLPNSSSSITVSIFSSLTDAAKIIKKEAGGEKSDIQCNFIVTRNV